MKGKNSTDNFQTLLQSVIRRQQGHRDDAFERELENDAFLQTVVSGLEHSLAEREEGELIAMVETQKNRLWKNIAAKMPGPSLWSRLKEKIHYLQQEFRMAQFEYMLGFNCSCLILLLSLCFWLRFHNEMPELITHVEFPEGFKP